MYAKLHTRTRAFILGGFILALAGLLVLLKLGSYSSEGIEQASQAVQVSPAPADPQPPLQAAVATGEPKYIVGAIPRLNPDQKFLPPTSSVEVKGGEEELSRLIEQTRPRPNQTNATR